MVVKITDKKEKGSIAREVLEALPDWFGIPEYVEEYIESSMELPFWVDREENKVRGFIVIKETSQYAAELCVMGVKKEFHKKGIGRKLFEAMYEYAKEQKYEFLQVKTVKEGCYEDYDQTNAFYKRLGFKEFECFPLLWDEHNPCQIYIMSVR